jgi:excisionase family DNA binding protein
MHATRPPELLRIPEAAERLNVSRASVYRWIEEGRLPAVQLGGRGAPLRIPGAELAGWLAEHRTSTSAGEHSSMPAETPAELDGTSETGEAVEPGAAPRGKRKEPMNPHELLAQRHRDYRKAQNRHVRAVEKQQVAAERIQQLERELAEAEDEDRRELGEALIDGAKPPAGKAERVRAALGGRCGPLPGGTWREVRALAARLSSWGGTYPWLVVSIGIVHVDDADPNTLSWATCHR